MAVTNHSVRGIYVGTAHHIMLSDKAMWFDDTLCITYT